MKRSPMALALVILQLVFAAQAHAQKTAGNSVVGGEDEPLPPIEIASDSADDEEESSLTRALTDRLSLLPRLPSGLQVELGAGSLSLQSLIPPFLMHSSAVPVYFTAFHAGLASDQSYIDIDLCPYLGGGSSTFILDVRSGYWFLREDEEDVELIFTRLSSWFYATVTSYKSLQETTTTSEGYGGSGFLNTGVGFTAELGFNAMNWFKLLLGGYASYGVLFPTVGIVDFGMTADAEIPIGKTGLELYGHFVLWKNVMDYATLQGGLRYRLP